MFHLYILSTLFHVSCYQKIHSGPTNGCIRDKVAFYLVHEVRRCNNYDSPSSKSCSYFNVLEKIYLKKNRWQEIKRSWFLSISSHFQIHCQLRRDISPWGSKGYNGWIKRNRDLETFVFPRLSGTFNTYSLDGNWTFKWEQNDRGQSRIRYVHIALIAKEAVWDSPFKNYRPKHNHCLYNS